MPYRGISSDNNWHLGYYPRYGCYYFDKRKRRMNIEGEGNVKASPDIAIVTLGVITENESLEIAQKENAIRTNRVLKTLNEIGISDKDIQTIGYNINQKYDYIEGKRVFQGYEVINRFTVTIKDIEKIGEVIDAAVKNGANLASNIKFSVSNPSIYYRKALTLAIEDSIRKAKDVGRTLEVAVNEVPIKIIEESYNSIYVPKSPGFRAPETITPISPGQLEISANIRAVFSY